MKSLFRFSAATLLGPALLITGGLAALTLWSPGDLAETDSVRRSLFFGHAILFTILLAGLLALRRDERRRRQVEEELRHSESQARTVLETAVDAIISIDERGIIERVNPATERILGYSGSELIGRNVNVLMPSPDQESHDGYLARYLATGERKIIGIGREVVCRRKDGMQFPADLAVGEYRVKAERKFTGFLRDISDRKRAEAHIREQAALLDKAREAILVRDLDDRITYWNRGAERLYGWSAAEACGRSCRDLLLRGNGGQLEPGKRAVLTEGEWAGELKKIARDGRELVIESRWSLLRDDAQRPSAILVIEADVTEKKESERHALRAQRLESIGTLAGGIAHDLNNMLTPILMSASLLQKDRSPAERERLLANIQASAQRGAEMVRQLLSFTGSLETQRMPVDLARVIAEIKSLLDHTLPKSIAIQTALSDDLWTVAGDETQLSQVLMNLCVNSRDAMPDGGLLSIAAENRVGNESGVRPEPVSGPHVVLTVTDTGKGIPPDVLDRVFDPFFTTKEQGKGTGLGLSTVLGIVKSHGGTVHLESKLGQGTRFSICLPAFDSRAAEPAEVVRHAPANGGQETILVVDDEEFVLIAVRASLEEAGYRVLTARDGAEAASLLRDHRGAVRAALVDMMMPGMDGPATMAVLEEIDPRLRIIATSGLRAADEAAGSVAARARAFLPKPYTDEQLRAIVSKVLQGEA